MSLIYIPSPVRRHGHRFHNQAERVILLHRPCKAPSISKIYSICHQTASQWLERPNEPAQSPTWINGNCSKSTRGSKLQKCDQEMLSRSLFWWLKYGAISIRPPFVLTSMVAKRVKIPLCSGRTDRHSADQPSFCTDIMARTLLKLVQCTWFKCSALLCPFSCSVCTKYMDLHCKQLREYILCDQDHPVLGGKIPVQVERSVGCIVASTSFAGR